MLSLDQVMTLSEAADKWGFSDGATIRKAIERGKFQDHQIKRSGRVWLLTYDAMEKVFGQPQAPGTVNIEIGMFLDKMIKRDLNDDDPIIMTIIERIRDSLLSEKSVILFGVEKEVVIRLDSIEELSLWLRRMRYAFKLSTRYLKSIDVY